MAQRMDENMAQSITESMALRMTESMALSIAKWIISSIALSFALAVAEIGRYSESNFYQLKVERSAHVKIYNIKLRPY